VRPRALAAAGALQPIRLRWRNAPGNKLDWIGIYRSGSLDTYDYLGFSYLGALPHGSVSFAPGDLLARTSFRVR
jgi:hypothetical protein